MKKIIFLLFIVFEATYIFAMSKTEYYQVISKVWKEAGMPIAELGNSSSSSPHLHFGVYSPNWLVTYPVRFKYYTIIKKKLKTYIKTGQPGGKDGFEVIEVK